MVQPAAKRLVTEATIVELTQDIIATMILEGSGLSAVYDDSAGTYTLVNLADKAFVGLSQANNTSDANKPISLAVAKMVQWARNLDQLIVGTITRDSNGAATSAPVVWPDGTTGTYTALAVSGAFPGAVDSYKVTYVGSTTLTFTQPAVTRNSSGVVTALPAIVVT